MTTVSVRAKELVTELRWACHEMATAPLGSKEGDPFVARRSRANAALDNYIAALERIRDCALKLDEDGTPTEDWDALMRAIAAVPK